MYMNNYDLWLEKSKDLHKGERCFLLGCGPSLNQVDLSYLSNEIVMGVNGTYMLEEISLTYFVTVSYYFWKSHKENLKKLNCKRRFLPDYLEELTSITPTSWLNHSHVSSENSYKFSYEPHRKVYLGGSVIFVCLQLLLYLGFNEVIILGLDHDYGIDKKALSKTGNMIKSDELKAHFSSNYYRKGENVHIDLAVMERVYELSMKAFAAVGRKIYNASPGTKLATFPIRDYLSFF